MIGQRCDVDVRGERCELILEMLLYEMEARVVFRDGAIDRDRANGVHAVDRARTKGCCSIRKQMLMIMTESKTAGKIAIA